MAAGTLSFSIYGKENDTLKILGQSIPDVNTATDLYTVPGSTQTIISSITVTNKGSSTAYFRISVSANGAATATKDYIAYGESITANSTISYTLGITIDDSDKVRVMSFPGAPVSGYTVWYDASDSSTITHSSNAISQWDDKSANAYHLTQATGANQPTYSGTQNGRKLVTFASSGPQYMTNTTFATLAQPFTCCVVLGSLSDTATAKQVVNANASTGTGSILKFGSGEDAKIAMGTDLTGATSALTGAHAYITVANSASSAIYVDGVSDASGDAGSNSMADIRIGATSGATQGLDGTVGEIIIYGSSLSTSDRELNTAYLKNKWGTP